MSNIIIYTNNRRLFRLFKSELTLGVLVLLTLATSIITMFIPYSILLYAPLVFGAMVIGFLVIGSLICYRQDMGFFRIRKLR